MSTWTLIRLALSFGLGSYQYVNGRKLFKDFQAALGLALILTTLSIVILAHRTVDVRVKYTHPTTTTVRPVKA